MRPLVFALSVLLSVVTLTFAADKPKPKPKPKATPPVSAFVKNTNWPGKIVAIDDATITVVSDKALTRVFSIQPGTVFGNGNGKLADFKVGMSVVVSFSEVLGSTTAKAENISAAKVKR